MEEHQKSLAQFLMKTSFTILTGLGGLSALMSGVAGGLNLNLSAVTVLLFWVSAALLLVSTMYCWRVVSIASGSARDTVRDVALKWGKRSFITAMIVLILSPVGLPFRISLSPLSFSIASPSKNVALEYSAINNNKITSSPTSTFYFTFTVKNLGPAFDSLVEVESPTNTNIVATLSENAFYLERNDINAVNCKVSINSESELGSYPLIIKVKSGNQIIRSEYIEIEVIGQ